MLYRVNSCGRKRGFKSLFKLLYVKIFAFLNQANFKTYLTLVDNYHNIDLLIKKCNATSLKAVLFFYFSQSKTRLSLAHYKIIIITSCRKISGILLKFHRIKYILKFL